MSINKGRLGKIVRNALMREQAEMLRKLQALRWEYFCRYTDYLEEKGLDPTDFSFYEYLLIAERRKGG